MKAGLASVDALQTIPDGVAEAAELIDRLDDCLLHGFARLGPQHRDSLESLASTFAGSPLEKPVTDAVAAVGRSEYLVKYFVALAAARAAFQGAQYDALLGQAREVFGIESLAAEPPPMVAAGAAAAIQSSTQQWLLEIALAGFKHLVEDSVAPFVATLERLQAEPVLLGTAALLTGFVNELLACMPAERQAALPVFRWADLWSTAMLRCEQMLGPPAFQQLDGELIPLGLDMQSHANFVCVLLYGFFTSQDISQTVRVPLVSYKVDVLSGPEIWDLFGPVADPLLKALESHKALAVRQAELHGNGDLILKSPPRVAGAADPFSVAERITSLPALPALLRHPVHIAEPVHLQGELTLAVAADRLPAGTELDDKVLKDAREMIGLLRFDRGEWRVQPLCVRGSKSDVISGQSLAKARAKQKSQTLAVLKERSSKLLRESSGK